MSRFDETFDSLLPELRDDLERIYVRLQAIGAECQMIKISNAQVERMTQKRIAALLREMVSRGRRINQMNKLQEKNNYTRDEINKTALPFYLGYRWHFTESLNVGTIMLCKGRAKEFRSPVKHAEKPIAFRYAFEVDAYIPLYNRTHLKIKPEQLQPYEYWSGKL